MESGPWLAADTVTASLHSEPADRHAPAVYRPASTVTGHRYTRLDTPSTTDPPRPRSAVLGSARQRSARCSRCFPVGSGSFRPVDTQHEFVPGDNDEKSKLGRWSVRERRSVSELKPTDALSLLLAAAAAGTARWGPTRLSPAARRQSATAHLAPLPSPSGRSAAAQLAAKLRLKRLPLLAAEPRSFRIAAAQPSAAEIGFSLFIDGRRP